MSDELNSLHRKTVGLTLRVQQVAFLVAAVALTTLILLIHFQPPSLSNVIIVITCVTSAFVSGMVLVQTWWYTSIRRFIISPAEWYRILGYNLFLCCVLWAGFFLWQANLLNFTSSIFLLGVCFVYHRFNRTWARVSFVPTTTPLAKGSKSR